MPEHEESGSILGYALGATIGTVLWNGLFLGLSWAGLISGDLAWTAIQTIYAMAFIFLMLLLVAA